MTMPAIVHKYSGMHTTADVTLKRGVVDTSDLWAWITDARTNGSSAQRDVTITLRDEAGNSVQVFKLYSVTPKGYTGPSLVGKAAGRHCHRGTGAGSGDDRDHAAGVAAGERIGRRIYSGALCHAGEPPSFDRVTDRMRVGATEDC